MGNVCQELDSNSEAHHQIHEAHSVQLDVEEHHAAEHAQQNGREAEQQDDSEPEGACYYQGDQEDRDPSKGEQPDGVTRNGEVLLKEGVEHGVGVHAGRRAGAACTRGHLLTDACWHAPAYT